MVNVRLGTASGRHCPAEQPQLHDWGEMRSI